MTQKNKRMISGIAMISGVAIVALVVLLSPKGAVIPETEAEYVLAQTPAAQNSESSPEERVVTSTPPDSSEPDTATTSAETVTSKEPFSRPKTVRPKKTASSKPPQKKETSSKPKKDTASSKKSKSPVSSRAAPAQPASSAPPAKSIWEKPLDLLGIRQELLAYGRDLGLKYNPNLKASSAKNITAKISSGSKNFRSSCRSTLKQEYKKYKDFGGFNVIIEGTEQSCMVYILRG